MKMIYLHQYFTIPYMPGSTRSWEFCKRLVRDGWNIIMVTAGNNLPDNQVLDDFFTQELGHLPGSFTLKVAKVNYNNNMSFPRRILAFFLFALKSMWLTIKEPSVNITFATSTPLTIVIPALVRKWLRGTPYVFEVRDLWPEGPIAVNALRSPISIFLARHLEKIAYRQASNIIALSPGMMKGVTVAGISESKIEVITNGADTDEFNIPSSVGKKFLLDHPELNVGPLIVYAGTFGLLNGVDYLARLAKEMKEINPKVRFFACGSGAKFRDVELLAQKLGVLGDNFILSPPIAKKDVPALLSAATIVSVVFLPVKEMEKNSANKFFDALAAGRPVMINYGGWQKEIIERTGVGISISSDDLVKAANDLNSFITNESLLESARKASLKLAYDEFNRDKLYQKLSHVLKSAI